jgi:hypothetical protein
VHRDARSENERLVTESRKLRAQLRVALEAVEEVEDSWTTVKAPEAEAA